MKYCQNILDKVRIKNSLIFINASASSSNATIKAIHVQRFEPLHQRPADHKKVRQLLTNKLKISIRKIQFSIVFNRREKVRFLTSIRSDQKETEAKNSHHNRKNELTQQHASI
jgi:hypothetical protein